MVRNYKLRLKKDRFTLVKRAILEPLNFAYYEPVQIRW
ncbi:hypothetical protein SAMN05518672_104543 [Chitinophaga sp. CF118]|nr:hypothetical protein SAMN05518672_104543 [Chitinophaga sp. CF118]